MKSIGIWKEQMKMLGGVCDERSLREKITAEPRETEGTRMGDRISNVLVRSNSKWSPSAFLLVFGCQYCFSVVPRVLACNISDLRLHCV